jgi:hypothetical protein
MIWFWSFNSLTPNVGHNVVTFVAAVKTLEKRDLTLRKTLRRNFLWSGDKYTYIFPDTWVMEFSRPKKYIFWTNPGFTPSGFTPRCTKRLDAQRLYAQKCNVQSKYKIRMRDCGKWWPTGVRSWMRTISIAPVARRRKMRVMRTNYTPYTARKKKVFLLLNRSFPYIAEKFQYFYAGCGGGWGRFWYFYIFIT